MKRVMDFTLASFLLLMFAPMLLMVAMLVRIYLGAPILFKQIRPGLDGKPFRLYKFRTMTDDRDSDGKFLADHLRLTPLGQWLRKYSLDELPQLWNVVIGDLSLVGPRPLLMEYMKLYSEEQAKRHLVRPGMTGWAQIHGRNQLTWEEKFELDLWYVEHQSVLLDLKILLRTLRKVLRSEGIAHPNQVTMSKFTGSIQSKRGENNQDHTGWRWRTW